MFDFIKHIYGDRGRDTYERWKVFRRQGSLEIRTKTLPFTIVTTPATTRCACLAAAAPDMKHLLGILSAWSTAESTKVCAYTDVQREAFKEVAESIDAILALTEPKKD